MGQGYSARRRDSLSPIVDAISSVEVRTSQNERPTGTSLSNLVAQVKAALVGINAQVAAAVAAYLASLTNLSISGTLTAGTVNVSGSINVTTGPLRGADLYATNAPGFNITGGRVTAWLETATGRLGMASSSRTLKTDIEPFSLEKSRLVLGIGIYYWHYIAELRKRDDPTYEGYIGPEYHVSSNFGAMAEDFHAAGLWELVVYRRTDIYESRPTGEVAEDGTEVMADVVIRQELYLDAHGEPQPIAIQDALIAYALIPVVADHDSRLAAIEAHLGIGSSS